MIGKTLRPILISSLLLLLPVAPARGAVGDLLKTVDLPLSAHCSLGTSVAAVPGNLVGFPAVPVLLVISCFGGNQLFYLDFSTNPATLVKTVTTVPTPPNGWGSLAYRADQGDLTGCGNDDSTHPLYRINPNTGAATFLFNSVAGFTICDGHTWDASDQTFFVSPDVSSTIYHFGATGLPLGSVPAAGGCPNSGVVVGGSVLYEACNGVLTIFRADKTSGAVLGSFSSAGSRTEDLECDPISFGVDAMWSKDAFDNELFAFEIPKGECGFGGEPPEIEVAVDIKPTSCPNPLQCKSKGVVPVAILGSVDLDVTTIDPASVLLAGVAPLRAEVADVATPFLPMIGKSGCLDCTTAGPDGFPDLTLKFDTQQLLQALGPAANGACLVVKLSGNLREELGGTPIAGEDVMRFQCK
jgi:hypothetical protein